MTSIIPFVPSNIVAPRFKATLDGSVYDVSVTWNISSLRYYINIYDANGTWILTTALVSSPPARNIISCVYDPFLNSMVVQLVDPSQWPIPATGPMTRPGEMLDYTLEEFQPPSYNGKFRCMHITDTIFTFPMPTDPGPLVVLGRVSRLLSMVDTKFLRSTMVYRNGAFEISP